MTVVPLMPNDSVAKIFRHRVQEMGPQVAMRQKVRGLWKPVSWARYGARARGLGLGLAAQGLGRQDRVVIMARPGPAWVMAEMAILAMGGIAVPVDLERQTQESVHILRDCGASFCFVENWEVAAQIHRHRQAVPALKKIIVMNPRTTLPTRDPMVISLRDVFTAASDAGTASTTLWETAIDATLAEDVALLIYAPGESAPSGGAMITHDNLVFQMMAAQSIMPLDARDRVLGFLNPAHMTTHLFDVFYHLVFAFTLYFPESAPSVGRDRRQVRPTVYWAPETHWESLRAEVRGVAGAASALQRLAVRGADALGQKRVQREMTGRAAPIWLKGIEAPFQAVVQRRVRGYLGLDQCRLAVALAGSAESAAEDVAAWAQVLGMDWVWALGQPQTTGLAWLKALKRRRPACDGPVPQTQTRLTPDGVLLVKGRHVCPGVWPVLDKNPREPGDWFTSGVRLGTLKSAPSVVARQKER